jgi:hypothetical protein
MLSVWMKLRKWCFEVSDGSSTTVAIFMWKSELLPSGREGLDERYIDRGSVWVFTPEQQAEIEATWKSNRSEMADSRQPKRH